MPYDPNLNSLLVRLKNAGDFEFSNTLGELLGDKIALDQNAIDQIFRIVEGRVDAGKFVLPDHLACLLLRASSSQLYQRVREDLLKNPRTVLTLYKGKYPDRELEEILCAKLYEIASDNGEYFRREILEAMRDVGSPAVLSTLDAILFDLAPSARIRGMFSNVLGPVKVSETRSLADFVKDVDRTIEEIKKRISSTPESEASNSSKDKEAEQKNEVSNAHHAAIQAKQFIDLSPEVATMYLRRGAEALAKDLYRRLGHEKNGKPARKMTLEDLLKPVKDSDAPEVFKMIVQTFQLFGNFAAHDQDDQSKYMTKEIGQPLIALYDQALLLYSTWANNLSPGEPIS